MATPNGTISLNVGEVQPPNESERPAFMYTFGNTDDQLTAAPRDGRGIPCRVTLPSGVVVYKSSKSDLHKYLLERGFIGGTVASFLLQTRGKTEYEVTDQDGRKMLIEFGSQRKRKDLPQSPCVTPPTEEDSEEEEAGPLPHPLPRPQPSFRKRGRPSAAEFYVKHMNANLKTYQSKIETAHRKKKSLIEQIEKCNAVIENSGRAVTELRELRDLIGRGESYGS